MDAYIWRRNAALIIDRLHPEKSNKPFLLFVFLLVAQILWNVIWICLTLLPGFTLKCDAIILSADQLRKAKIFIRASGLIFILITCCTFPMIYKKRRRTAFLTGAFLVICIFTSWSFGVQFHFKYPEVPLFLISCGFLYRAFNDSLNSEF